MNVVVVGAILGYLAGLALAVGVVHALHHLHRRDVVPYALSPAVNVVQTTVLTLGCLLLGAWVAS